jgi:hypothetical protein
MRRLLVTTALALPLLALTAPPTIADVRTRERTAIKFEGMLGRVVGMFGGRAARDGIVSTTVVKGIARRRSPTRRRRSSTCRRNGYTTWT